MEMSYIEEKEWGNVIAQEYARGTANTTLRAETEAAPNAISFVGYAVGDAPLPEVWTASGSQNAASAWQHDGCLMKKIGAVGEGVPADWRELDNHNKYKI